MSSPAEQIIDYLRENRVSTTEVADALGKKGVLPGIKPLQIGSHHVGRVRVVFAANGSNYHLHRDIRQVNPGEVVIVFPQNCGDRAVLGELIARWVLLYQGAEALVVDGLVRDFARLNREGASLWYKGVTPIGCTHADLGEVSASFRRAKLDRFDGGVAICDDGGVVVIPPNHLDEDMLDRIQRVELQEDVWHYCLNVLKWDTKRIVCDREYLKEIDDLPPVFRAALTDLHKGFPPIDE